MCRDCIEPPLQTLEISGIPIGEKGEGVVAFYVPQSHAGPHRHVQTRECYVRRADRSEKLTMREIQDLTLNLERGTAAIQKAFKKRRKTFEAKFQAVLTKANDDQEHFGVRVTAIPLSPLRVGNVHKIEVVRPTPDEIAAELNGCPVKLGVPDPRYGSHPEWKPILRGTSASFSTNTLNGALCVKIELTQEGLVEYTLVYLAEPLHVFFPAWFMCLVSNAFCSVERFRNYAKMPGVKYAVEAEVIPTKNPTGEGRIRIHAYNDTNVEKEHCALAKLPNDPIQFPQYSLGSSEGFQELAARIDRDFWNAVHVDSPSKLLVNFPLALLRS